MMVKGEQKGRKRGWRCNCNVLWCALLSSLTSDLVKVEGQAARGVRKDQSAVPEPDICFPARGTQEPAHQLKLTFQV